MGTAQIIARPRALSRSEIEQLEPYAFFAVLGNRVIHPGGRAATEPRGGCSRVARAVPYLGFILVSGTRPVTVEEA